MIHYPVGCPKSTDRCSLTTSSRCPVSTRTRTPCVVRPRPKDEAALVVPVLHDDVGFYRDFHRLTRFLIFGRSYSQENSGRVFHEIGLFGVGIAPATRTETVNNSQDLLALNDVRAFCFGHGDHPLALWSNKSLFRILDGPVGKLAV